MVNNIEIKNKYYEFMEKMSHLSKRLDMNMSRCEKYTRNDLFALFENEDYYHFFMSNLDEMQEQGEYKDFNLKELRKDYENYSLLTGRLINKRLEIYDECMDLNIEFDKWSNDLNLTYKELDAWRDEREWYKCEWRSWGDHIIHKAMMLSIKSSDESVIETMINNARKVLKLVGCTDENDIYEAHFCLWCIETINKYTRHDIYEGANNVFSLDCLENRGLYLPDREHFMMGVLRVMRLVDDVFLYLCEDVDCI